MSNSESEVRPISLTDPKTYDVDGRLTGKQYPDTSTVTYAYETTTSWLKSVIYAASQVKTYSYARDDRLLGALQVQEQTAFGSGAARIFRSAAT